MSDLKRGAITSLGLAGLLGVYLTMVGGWPILTLGICSVLAAIAFLAGAFSPRLPRSWRCLCPHLFWVWRCVWHLFCTPSYADSRDLGLGLQRGRTGDGPSWSSTTQETVTPIPKLGSERSLSDSAPQPPAFNTQCSFVLHTSSQLPSTSLRPRLRTYGR